MKASLFRWTGCALLLSLGSACSDGGGNPTGDGGSSMDSALGDARDAQTPRDGAVTSDVTSSDADAGCADHRRACDGVCCAAGEVCGGHFCCATTAFCGDVCCGPGTRCEAGACVPDCGANARCGDPGSEVCCAAGQVCYLGACQAPGAECNELTPCPSGQYCEPSLMHCLPVATGEACEYRPPVSGTFTPTVRWQWRSDPMVLPAYNQVMMQPVVANLDDDNHDGHVDHNDTPDVVFITFTGSNYWSDGVVRAVSGRDGSRLWPAVGATPAYRATPGASIAIAELDATHPGPEIVTCTASNSSSNVAGHVLILTADGALLREIAAVPCGFSAPAIADADGDGVPEIAVRNRIFHVDGTVLPGFPAAITTGTSGDDFPSFADLNGDGTQELVFGDRALRLDGTALWTQSGGGYPAVADLTGDGMPEVATVQSGTHAIIVRDGRTGATVWGPIELNREMATVGPSGGGPPTIADFNGDGHPDVASAGGYNYLVLDGRDGTLIWESPSQDHSSRVTGSSVFDFEGDGPAEAVYNDELQLRVFRGRDGMVEFSRCNTSGTLWEYPVIVDVDNDEHAEIVVMSNNYAFQCPGGPGPTGITVYGDPSGNWVRTRRIWNQHTYHVTNIDEDGNVPRHETPNWTVPNLNNFRQNVQPDGLFDAPDLVPADLTADTTRCTAQLTFRVRVVNRGRAGAPAGVPVSFYLGTPEGTHMLLGTGLTARRLLPGESEIVSFDYVLPAGMSTATFSVYAVLNDTTVTPLETLHECRADNNTATPRGFMCPNIG